MHQQLAYMSKERENQQSREKENKQEDDNTGDDTPCRHTPSFRHFLSKGSVRAPRAPPVYAPGQHIVRLNYFIVFSAHIMVGCLRNISQYCEDGRTTIYI